MREKTLRDKTYANCEILWLFIKVFSMKFGGMASFGGISEHFTKVFLCKSYFSPIHESFLPRKLPATQNILPIFALQISIGIIFNRLPFS